MQAIGNVRRSCTGKQLENSVQRQNGQCRTQALDQPLIARGDSLCLIYQRNHVNDAKTGTKAFQAMQGEVPTGFVGGALQQIDLPVSAFHECATQIMDERYIIAHGSLQGCVEITAFKSHPATIATQG